MNKIQKKIINQVQINIPFRMLCEKYLDIFIDNKLNPEIGIDADSLDSYTVSDYEEVAALFDKNRSRITVHGPFLDLSPGSPDPSIRSVTRYRFEQVLELIPVLKPVSVVCHTGYDEDRYGFQYDSWFEQSIEMWQWFGNKLWQLGTCLMLENVYEHKPDEILPFFRRLHKQGVCFCLDLGHQAAFGKVSLDSWLDEAGMFIGQLHLHDNHGARDEHLPLGAGTIDFSPLISFLKSQRFKNMKGMPIITLEPHSEEDLWPNLDYLSSVVITHRF